MNVCDSRVFVGRLVESITESTIRTHFGRFGEVITD